MHEEHAACIQACWDCAVACNHCLMACLQEADVRPLTRCIALDIDCAEACALAAAMMSRGSEMAKHACQMCADISAACAEECAKHRHGHCQKCAEACRQCADACRKMGAA